MDVVANAKYLQPGQCWEWNLDAFSNGALVCEDEAKAQEEIDHLNVRGKTTACNIAAITLVSVSILLGLTLHRSAFALALVGIGGDYAAISYFNGQQQGLQNNLENKQRATNAICTGIVTQLSLIMQTTLKESVVGTDLPNGHEGFRYAQDAAAKSRQVVVAWQKNGKTATAQKFRLIENALLRCVSFPSFGDRHQAQKQVCVQALAVLTGHAGRDPSVGYHKIVERNFRYWLEVPA